MSSRQNPLHLSSCYCYGYRFWGGPIAFQGFVEISMFKFLHFPFIFLSFSFQCAFTSFHLPSICMHFPLILHSCPFMSFLKLWKWLYGLARGLSAINGYRWVIAKVIELSLNNPSNMWDCRRTFVTKLARERERQREERKRASELDAKWYGNCRKQGTTGWISLIGFARSVNGLGLRQV